VDYLRSIESFHVDVDTYVVFSFLADKLGFEATRAAYTGGALTQRYETILMEEIGPDMNAKLHEALGKRSIVSYKKLWALHHLMVTTGNSKQYTHFATVDCELVANADGRDFAKNVQFYTDNVRTFPSMKIINRPLYPYVIGRSWGWFDRPGEIDILRSKSQNFFLYPWFAQFPIFDVKHLPGFFERVPIDLFLARSEWEMFDHLIYQGYVMLYGGYEILDYSTRFQFGCPSCEEVIMGDNGAAAMPDFCREAFPLWQALRPEHNFPICNSSVFLYHLDRAVLLEPL
jgi:hypothetical protein